MIYLAEKIDWISKYYTMEIFILGLSSGDDQMGWIKDCYLHSH